MAQAPNLAPPAAVNGAQPTQQGSWWVRPFQGLLGRHQPKNGLLGRLFATSQQADSSSNSIGSGQSSAAPTHLVVMVNGLFGNSCECPLSSIRSTAVPCKLLPSQNLHFFPARCHCPGRLHTWIPVMCIHANLIKVALKPLLTKCFVTANWDAVSEQLKQHLDAEHTLLYPSTANARFATYDGIDVCGGRLAEEVRHVVAQQQSLQRISVIAHSMGGLMARYAIGVLYNPSNNSIIGLEPAHFVSLATPHCGCDSDGVAQVPFIGWTGGLPLLGQQLFRFLQGISGPTAAMLFKRTGQQFFLLDGKQMAQEQQSTQPQQQQDRQSQLQASFSSAQSSRTSGHNGSDSDSHCSAYDDSTAGLPVLLQMTQDCPDRGLYFYSGLSAFKTRTCYANIDGDHLVGFANSSIRRLADLPPLPPAMSTAKGVVLDDPLSAAFFPQQWQQLQQHWQSNQQPNASNLSSVSAVVSEPYQPSRSWQLGARAATSVGVVSSSELWREVQTSSAAAVAQRQPLLAGSLSRLSQVQQASQLQQQRDTSSMAALQLAGVEATAAATEADADLLVQSIPLPIPSQQLGFTSSPDSSTDQLMDLEMSGSEAVVAAADSSSSASSSSSSRHQDNVRSSPVAAAPAGADAAAEQDLASGLSGQGTPAAPTPRAAANAVSSDAAAFAEQLGSSSRAQLVSHMLHRLQELPWRRVDVSFQGAKFGFAHNNIQVTRRWWNFEGEAVPRHLAQQLQLMDMPFAAGQPQVSPTATATREINLEDCSGADTCEPVALEAN
eukprot:GHRR01013291.1.p1 GENE.GHRR01013291.1~~GHRR01013291.1.p1  ORF type:complete len:777 (+),score=287.73 GHRR01013291.1:426-2756(+)